MAPLPLWFSPHILNWLRAAGINHPFGNDDGGCGYRPGTVFAMTVPDMVRATAGRTALDERIQMNKAFRIAVMAGDGIGPEVMAPCVDLLDRVTAQIGGFDLSFEWLECGAAHYRETGAALPDEVFAAAQQADAILLGAMGLPSVRYPDGREIGPQLDLRERLELFAGVRPVRTYPGLPVPLSDARAQTLDFVLIRESTEGLFASRGKSEITEDYARDFVHLSRTGCERLFDFSFRLGQSRRTAGHPGRVTCVDKANVLGSFAWFREIFDTRAKAFPDIIPEAAYVDAVALNMVRNPWVYDVLVTENMFGDILSDIGAALMGGMGFAPSADIGANHAVFQPCHGSAPDIAGEGKANPTAMILSGAMMLDWLGEQHSIDACREAAALLDGAVRQAFATGRLHPIETGGGHGLRDITDAVADALPR